MSSNVVYVGSKPLSNYCRAILRAFNEHDTIILRARWASVSRAVDAVEVTRNRYLEGVLVDSIKIDTEKMRSTDGSIRHVSKMTITLTKQDN